jgi:hypothetical protein
MCADVRTSHRDVQRLALAFGCVGKAVRARRHHGGHTIAEPVSDILQPVYALRLLELTNWI